MTTKKKITNFVPIWEYCKEKNIQPQVVYRRIREGKMDENDYQFMEKVVKRLMIRKDIEIKVRPKKY